MSLKQISELPDVNFMLGKNGSVNVKSEKLLTPLISEAFPLSKLLIETDLKK